MVAVLRQRYQFFVQHKQPAVVFVLRKGIVGMEFLIELREIQLTSRKFPLTLIVGIKKRKSVRTANDGAPFINGTGMVDQENAIPFGGIPGDPDLLTPDIFQY